MMDKSFGLILAVIALIAGVMLLTGHGDILLKGGNAKLRKEKYDEKNPEWHLLHHFLHWKQTFY